MQSHNSGFISRGQLMDAEVSPPVPLGAPSELGPVLKEGNLLCTYLAGRGMDSTNT